MTFVIQLISYIGKHRITTHPLVNSLIYRYFGWILKTAYTSKWIHNSQDDICGEQVTKYKRDKGIDKL